MKVSRFRIPLAGYGEELTSILKHLVETRRHPITLFLLAEAWDARSDRQSLSTPIAPDSYCSVPGPPAAQVVATVSADRIGEDTLGPSPAPTPRP